MGRGTTYTEEEMYIISTMREAGKSYDEIRQRLAQAGIERSIGSLRNCAHEINNGEKKFDVESALAKLDGIEYVRYGIRGANCDPFFDGFNRNTVYKKGIVFCDMHIPFEFKDCIYHAIENHPDADFCVLNGDIFDMYSVSSFKKHLSMDLEVEYMQALEYFKLFSTTFKAVYVVEGNHERRPKNYKSDKLGNRFNGMIDFDPLSWCVKGMDFNDEGDFVTMHDFSNIVYRKKPRPDYERVGNCIFAHHNNYSTVEMKTVKNICEIYKQDHKNFDAVVIGHTHKSGRMIYNGKLLIEGGCCCIPPGYVVSSGRLPTAKWTYGYTVVGLSEDEGVVFDETYVVDLGTPTIKKERISVKEIP